LGLGCTRWVVERSFSWLHQLKRLRIRYEVALIRTLDNVTAWTRRLPQRLATHKT
jgi:transposase